MADKAPTGLTAASALDGSEVVHVVQGANSRKTTTQDIANLATGLAISDITNLQTELDNKIDDSQAAAGGLAVLGAANAAAVRAAAGLVIGTDVMGMGGGTFTGDISVPDEAYDATAWNGSLEVPTKNAVRDKIESLATSSYTGGVQSVPILAAAMTSRTTNGAASGTTETTTNKVMLATLDFDQSTEEYAQFMFPMPKSWNESTVTAQFIWTASSGTGDVIWGIQGVAISNDDALDAAFGTAQEVTDTLLATGDQHTTSFTSAVTIGGTPAEGDLVCFQVYRKAANGSDTLDADAKLIGLRLNITTNAADDS